MIEIVPYRPGWAAEFLEVSGALRRALGPLAMRIDHVGSTAVPGLRAKDVIDVQVTVDAFTAAVADRLVAAGFESVPGVSHDHVPPGSRGTEGDWAKLLFVQPAGRRRANIHVRRAGRPNQRYALLFRDYLRANPHVADAYGELKARLASSLADPSTYPEVKDPAVDLIYLAAEPWAAHTRWEPDEAAGTG